jgi:hypothetical protein
MRRFVRYSVIEMWLWRFQVKVDIEDFGDEEKVLRIRSRYLREELRPMKSGKRLGQSNRTSIFIIKFEIIRREQVESRTRTRTRH